MKRLLAASAVAVLLVLVGMLGVSGTASALSVCDAAGLLSLPSGLCEDPVTGQLSGGSQPITQPQRLTQTGGTLAAANGTGGTVAENAANAARNGALSAAGKIGLLGRLGQAGTLLAGFSGGMWLGSQVASVLCATGVSMECMPDTGKDATAFVPNTDVQAQAAPGWVPAMPLASGGTTVSLAMTDSSFPYKQPTAAPPSSYAAAAGNPVFGTGSYAGPSAALHLYSYCVNGTADGNWWFTFNPAPGPGAWAPEVSGNFAACVSSTTGGLDHLVLTIGGATVGTWYPVGHPLRPAPPDPNPSRTLTSTAQCVTVATGAKFTASATSVGFQETDKTWPAIPSVDCGPGAVAEGVTVNETTPGLPDKKIWGASAPAGVDSAITDAVCAGGKCRLSLVKVGPAGSALGDCFDNAGVCENWFEDPARDQDYQCVYGLPGAMQPTALSDCYVYAPTFNPSAQALGIGTADPATGDIPLTASGSDPANDPNAGDNSCWSSGWGAFNPLTWVLVPIKCALSWAFVPDHDLMQQASAMMSGAFTHLGVAQWTDSIFGPFASLPLVPDSCTPWQEAVPLSASYQPTETFLDPCQGLGLMLATTSKLIISAAAVIGGAWACFRAFSSIALGVHVAVNDASEINKL